MAIRRPRNGLVLTVSLLVVATLATAVQIPATAAGRAPVRHSGASPVPTIGGGRAVSLL